MEIAVTQIGYVEIETIDERAWLQLATAIGFEIVTADRGVGLRMDADRWARILLKKGEQERVSAIGWEAASAEDYRAILHRLDEAGARVKERPDLTALRNVQQLAQFYDPDGILSELYWGAQTTVRTPFRSPQYVPFVAGEAGMGHVTLAVRDLGATLAFYQSTLGLKITEIADVGQLSVAFLRAGERHHSLAISQMPSGRVAVDHVMVEVESLDDLGSIRDRLIDNGFPIDRDLGRHPTDGVVSMYLTTPGPFTLEVGWGSIAINDRTWATERYKRRSWSWGHRKPGATGISLGEAVAAQESPGSSDSTDLEVRAYAEGATWRCPR